MQQQFFYTHLIQLEALDDHLSRFKLEEEHHEKLLHLAHSTIHAEVMHFAITELPDEHQHKFLREFSKKPHDKGLMVFLRNSVTDFESKVKNIAREVESKLIHELHDYEEASVEWMSGN